MSKRIVFTPFLWVLCCLSSVDAFIDLIGDSPTALLLPKGQLESSFTFYKVNDSLDFFDVKDSLGVTSDTAGDMNGMGFGLRFGLSSKWTLLLDRYQRDYNFGRGVLHVKTDEIGIRTPISRLNGGKNQYALQINHRRNIGSGISKRFSSITFNNAVFNFDPPAEINFGGVGDREYGIQLIASRQLRPKLMGSVFAEFSRADIISNLTSSLPIDELQEVLQELSYSQSKKDLGYGFHYKLDSNNMLKADYHYLILKRSRDVSDPIRVNEIINAKFEQKLSNHSYWNLSAKYMKNQFIGEHSFLYNKLVASRSAKKYGYVGLGYTFRYGYGD